MEITKSGVLYEYADGTFEFVEGVEVPFEESPFKDLPVKFTPEIMRRVHEYHERKRSEHDKNTGGA